MWSNFSQFFKTFEILAHKNVNNERNETSKKYLSHSDSASKVAGIPRQYSDYPVSYASWNIVSSIVCSFK